jgi:hypothetical protein
MNLRRLRRRITRRGARRAARRVSRRILVAEDAVKIEQETGQPVEELTEEQLLAAMKRLGIQTLELDDE